MNLPNNPKARVIAFYLPQFHPIPENDKWWGKGFTEWTNVAKAKPLFKGHYQPRIPADLGFYDLRLPEVREQQAQMAREAGIEGFCYWHYWFSHDKKLLEKPFQEVLQSGKPNFPFCLGWANHNWTNKSWEAGTRQQKEMTLMEMVYNENEYRKHFYDVLPAFKDKRYITVDGKPIFYIWSALGIPNPKEFIQLWQRLAKENGLKGIYFIGHGAIENREKILNLGFDAFNDSSTLEILRKTNKISFLWKKMRALVFKRPIVFKYSEAQKYWTKDIHKQIDTIPTITPNWDHTPRSNNKGIVLQGSTPQKFKKHLSDVVNCVIDKPYENRIIFLKSWNEWGEGNYIEPDLQYGTKYLEVLKEVISDKNQ